MLQHKLLISFSIGLYYDELLCHVLPMHACHLLLGRPWLPDNPVIYDGYANTYSLMHKGCNFTLTCLFLSNRLIVNIRKGRGKSLHQSKTRDECDTSKSKPQISLLMFKPNTRRRWTLYILCLQYFLKLHGLTLGNPLPSKTCLEVKLGELGQTISTSSLTAHGLHLSSDECIKVLNKLMKTKDFKAHPSQDRVLDAEQITRCNYFI